jgi:hypothetical protein
MTDETKPDWTKLTPAQKQDAIRPHWTDGKSASEISAYFIGATRNSIISALSRGKMTGVKNKITSAQASERAKKSNEPRKTKPKHKNPMSVVSSSAFVTIENPDPPSSSVMAMIENNRPPLAGTTPISILDLPNRLGVVCRFPVIGGYCGVPCGDKAHCPTHHAIMYRETDKLRMPKEARL